MRTLSLLGVVLLSASAFAGDAVTRSAKSGTWSDGATWEGGKVPGAGARVLIRPGHSVVYDVNSDKVIRGVTIGGTLSFDPNKDTRLDVGVIKIEATDAYSEEGFECDAHAMAIHKSKPRAVFEVGTPNQPIAVGKRALIRLVYIEGMSKESAPAIICCGGRWDMHGTPMNRTWVRLGATAKAGDTQVTLQEAVTGWRVGDRVIFPVTGQTYGAKSVTEERIITAIDSPRPTGGEGPGVRGSVITIDKALEHEHLGSGDYRGEVANLSRNVTVESADPAGIRGHTMFHNGSAGSLSYAEFRHLGKKDTLGRYSIHFHLCGESMRGSSVIGCSIWDSHNRWLTIHGTNYLIVRDNVGYKSIGHGFFLEDGTEVYNVLDRNLAVGARKGKRLPKQVLPFDGNQGAGFWWANSLNTFTRNVAADCDLYGFRYEATPSSALKLDFAVQQPDGTKKKVDIRTLPFVRFDDNETHSNIGLYGVNLGEGVNKVGPDAKHPFIVRNLKIWNMHYGFRPQVPSLLVENLTIHKAAYGVYHPNYDNHVYRNVVISETHTEPFNRGHDDISIQYGVLVVDGLTFDGCRSGGMPLVQISDDNPNGKAESHFRNVKTVNWKDGSKAKAIVNLGGGPRPTPSTPKGVPIYLHDWYGEGKHAMVVSTRSPEFKLDPKLYKADAPLTGDESRVAEVQNIKMPNPLDPIDDLPPTTVITHIRMVKAGEYAIRGTTADNGTVKQVVVNGQIAKALAPNFAEWEITLSNAGKRIEASATDAAGNVEKRGHVVELQ
jgi:hypothetical protein